MKKPKDIYVPPYGIDDLVICGDLHLQEPIYKVRHIVQNNENGYSGIRYGSGYGTYATTIHNKENPRFSASYVDSTWYHPYIPPVLTPFEIEKALRKSDTILDQLAAEAIKTLRNQLKEQKKKVLKQIPSKT